MAEKDSTTITPKQGPGPETVSDAQEKLRTILAFAYLGKRANMSGDLTQEGWNKYFSEVGSPDGNFGQEPLMEAAFDGLLRMTSDVWWMLDDPKDAIEGRVIDRTQPQCPAAATAPPGSPKLNAYDPKYANAKVSVAALWKRLEDLEAVADDPAAVKTWCEKIFAELGECKVC